MGPEFCSMNKIVRREVERAIDIGQLSRRRTVAADGDITNTDRSGFCAIRFPEFSFRSMSRCALKNSVPLITTKLDGELDPLVLISLTRTVPASVPSDFQSSCPPDESDALKNSIPLTFVKIPDVEPLTPALISLTRIVPASVPSASPEFIVLDVINGTEEQSLH